MKKVVILYFAVWLSQSFSCEKKKPLGPQVVNFSLFFLIKANGARLPDSVLNNMKLSYYKGQVKNYVADFGRATEEGYGLGVQVTRDIGTISADAGIKNYYLEYPNGSQDTLFVDYMHLSYKEAVKNPCYCYYPLIAVKYNNKTSSLDPTITQQTVYLFIKL